MAVELFAKSTFLVKNYEMSGRMSIMKSKENIAKVVAMLKDHRDLRCTLTEELTKMPKTMKETI